MSISRNAYFTIVFVGFVAWVATCNRVSAATVTATSMGAYSQLGYNFATGSLDGRSGIVELPNAPGGLGGIQQTRLYAVFDLSGLADPVGAASLELTVEAYSSQGPGSFVTSPFGWTGESNPSEDFQIYSVESTISNLLIPHANPGTVPGTPNSTGTGIYADLANGSNFGTLTVQQTDVGSTLTVSLNTAAVGAINTAAGGDFALAVTFAGPAFGGAGGNFGAPLVEQYVDFTGTSALNLTIVPEPGTAMMLPTMIGVIAIRRRL